ncbi:phage shock protein PspC (stress-responsive transcriptional regulator) [Dysgonomonadaceae bacterium PH5-43]|nr:phage shock protein PspC (stress-responsive transcriptional regulator) [Dysgonomonadaceae bacterium PH5-43]
MKRTLTVNLNGRVFNIDEDAYQLLDNYLTNLRAYFSKEEDSDEIVADFEARIEELLSGRVRLGYNVISIEEVEKVIAQMGKPDDFGDDATSVDDSATNTQASSEGYAKPEEPVKKKLFRNPDDKVLGGVCSGLAMYFNCSVLALRLIAIVLIFLTSFWIVPVYLIAWLVIPRANTATQKLQMMGEPITLDNIGRVVSSNSIIQSNNDGCVLSFLKICLVVLCIFLGLPFLVLLIVALFKAIAAIFGIGVGGLMGFMPMFTFGLGNESISTIIALIFVVGIPVVSLLYVILSAIFKFSPLHKAIKWTGVIVWIIALVVLFAALSSKPFKLSSPFGFTFTKTVREYRGNGNLYNKEILFTDNVTEVSVDGIEATVNLEQHDADSTVVFISGDGDLVYMIDIERKPGGLLKINKGVHNPYAPTMPLIITIKTPNLNKIKIQGVENVNIVGNFTAQNLLLDIKDVESVIVDSLLVDKLDVKMKDILNVVLGGNAKAAYIDVRNVDVLDKKSLTVETYKSLRVK